MGVDAEAVLRLVGLLYEGLAAPDAWDGFLALLSRQLRCDCAALTFHDNRNQNPCLASSIGLSQNVASEWSAYFGNRNPRAPQILQALARRPSWVGVGSLVKAPAIYRESEYFPWLERHDFYHSLIAAVRVNGEAASLSFARPRTAKPFRPDAGELIRRILPHLQRVLQIHSRTQKLASLFEAGKMALDQLDTGVAALDASGRVILMNERAEAILEDPSIVDSLDRLVASALPTGRSEAATTVRGSGLHLIVTGTRPSAVAFLCNPAAKPASRASTLRSLFGLTPAECRLAGLLHEGMELRAAAESMRVTAATARFMLKRIFHKTGSHRQSQLIRLMSSLPGHG